MTPETRKKLLDAIAEYGHSLTRINGEKDQMKAITTKVQAELNVDARNFAKVATAMHKDSIGTAHKELNNLIGLFELVWEKPE